jgi:hypothetical protein
MRSVVDAEDVKLLVQFLMKVKFGPKPQEYGSSCLFQESRFLISVFNVRIILALKPAQQKL